jgi:hypothetical protein
LPFSSKVDLEHFCEFNKQTASKALDVYKEYADITIEVTRYLNEARKLPNTVGFKVPILDHVSSQRSFMSPISFSLTLAFAGTHFSG